MLPDRQRNVSCGQHDHADDPKPDGGARPLAVSVVEPLVVARQRDADVTPLGPGHLISEMNAREVFREKKSQPSRRAAGAGAQEVRAMDRST